ncbi:hypothetical protein A2U01_0074551, partial [Trifolium medium]|nr:hypothetical protein [Trifolium medium]
MIEERFGCIDTGINKVAESNIGAGDFDGDSVSRKGFDAAVLAEDEGWLEDCSEGKASVKNVIWPIKFYDNPWWCSGWFDCGGTY